MILKDIFQGDDMGIIDIQKQLEGAIPKASPAVQKVLVWLSQHTPEVAWKQVESIAREAGVSAASVVRAVQLAGFQGFFDLQTQVRDQEPAIPVAWQQVQQRQEGLVADSVGLVIGQETANLEQLGPILRVQVAGIVDWLLTRPHILVTASLMTTSLGEHVALNLRYLLGGVEFVDAVSSQAWMRLRDLTPDDGVIGISYPRYAKRTASFMAQCAERTSHILWITDLGGPGIPMAERVLRLPSASQSHYSSTVALMALVHVMAHELADRDPERIRGNLEEADRIWRALNDT